MIPFYLDNINQIDPDVQNIKDKDADDYTSFTFVQYYEGILMAVDSLKKIGFSAKIYVYDVDDDTAATLKMLENTELPKMHLIIGPFFENSLKVVARFAKKYNIKVVDPVSADDSILKGNPNVFNAFPSVNMQLKQLAAFIVERYSGYPIVIVHNNRENEKNYLTVFETALNNELKKTGKIENSFKEVVYNTDGVSGITRYFSNTDTNIVVTLTNGEIFVTNYVSKINDIHDKYKMIIFGLSSWRNFDNIETEYMQNIHLHLFSSSFVDYMDNNVKNFILKYRDQYKTEPNEYAFQGFDIAMFFFKTLNDYGINFEKCMDKTANAYLQSNYKFVRTCGKDGFENSFLNIFRYEDYKFVDVHKHPKIIETENGNK
jgi:ABC-type branched-subunit amino acid transport system substrate-binding protein